MTDVFAKSHRCRRCINAHHRLKLEPKDCFYWQYPTVCQECGEVRNIVTGIRPWSKWKLWFKKLDE